MRTKFRSESLKKRVYSKDLYVDGKDKIKMDLREIE